MPSIKQLEENSVPVVLQRGGIAITCQALVERISWSNPQYADLQNKAEELSQERTLLVNKHNVTLIADSLARDAYNDPAFIQRALEPVEDKPKVRKGKAEEAAPFADFAERSQQVQAAIDAADAKLKEANAAFQAALRENENAIFVQGCKRLSFLLKSWDLFDDDDEKQMTPTDAESLEKLFADKKEILMGRLVRVGDEVRSEPGLLELIEAATFGPLVNPSDSTA